MKITKDQLAQRDAEIDWAIAQLCFSALSEKVWHDFSPTTSWKDAGPIIEKYKVDIRYFDPETNPTLEGCWMGGIMIKNKKGITWYYTSFNNSPLKAAMQAVVLGLQSI